jgi:hypothetical protein
MGDVMMAEDQGYCMLSTLTLTLMKTTSLLEGMDDGVLFVVRYSIVY